MRGFFDKEPEYIDPRKRESQPDWVRTARGLGISAVIAGVVIVGLNFIDSQQSPPDDTCRADFNNPDTFDCYK